jgi:hypothetical protein
MTGALIDKIAAFATVYVGTRTATPPPTVSPSPTPTLAPTTSNDPPGPQTTAPPPPPPPTTPPACLDLVPPDLATPAHLADVGTLTPTLVWRYSGSCTPGGFQVQISSQRDFSTVDRSVDTGGTTTQWTVTPALSDCRTYYWRVRAYTGRTLGPWSSPFGFEVVLTRCP